MKIQIKNRFTGTVLFESDSESLGQAIIAALLAKTDLSWANLSRANLSGANLSWANFSGANLSGANLSWANFSGADLSGANFSRSDLSGANFSRSNFSRSNLSGADLSGANLSWANFSGANLSGANLLTIISQRTIIPDGDVIGWKKLQGGKICKLSIPANAKRIGGLVGRKCRAEFAVVLEGSGKSIRNGFDYEVGKTVTPDKYDPNPLVECSNGIHFFITREEAVAYN